MEELDKIINLINDPGIPLLITGGVLYLLWSIAKLLPSAFQTYISDSRNRDKQYEEQMKVIIVVAQQGIEAQRRGNEIIERNNIIMESRSRADEQLIKSLEGLCSQVGRVEDATKTNREIADKAYLEAIKVNERLQR